MASLVFGLLCGKVIVDEITKVPTFVDQLNGVGVPSFPASASWISVVTVWEREPDEPPRIEVRAVPVDPRGTERDDAAVEAVLDSSLPFHRWMLRLARWNVDVPGRWAIRLLARDGDEWRAHGEIPIRIDGPTPPARGTPPPPPAVRMQG